MLSLTNLPGACGAIHCGPQEELQHFSASGQSTSFLHGWSHAMITLGSITGHAPSFGSVGFKKFLVSILLHITIYKMASRGIKYSDSYIYERKHVPACGTISRARVTCNYLYYFIPFYSMVDIMSYTMVSNTWFWTPNNQGCYRNATCFNN